MKKTPFILHETFHSENERQRRECFQQVFTRYIGGVYLGTLDTAPRTAPLMNKQAASLRQEGRCGILWVGDYTERKGVNDESSYLLPFEQGG